VRASTLRTTVPGSPAGGTGGSEVLFRPCEVPLFYGRGYLIRSCLVVQGTAAACVRVVLCASCVRRFQVSGVRSGNVSLAVLRGLAGWLAHTCRCWVLDGLLG
jgi:hypothetical protein